ncbi:MAG: CopD family protein [Saprospiraceae bacterium]
MTFLLFKSIHIIAFVAWFAGLFYIVRLFVYHREADKLPADQRDILQRQYEIMQVRLYTIIMNPAMMLTYFCGTAMLIMNPDYLTQPWMQVKLVLLFALGGYHFACKKIMGDLISKSAGMSSFQFRLFNEVPTLLLVSIVLLAIFKNLIQFGLLFGSILLLGLLLFLMAKWYRSYRQKQM